MCSKFFLCLSRVTLKEVDVTGSTTGNLVRLSMTTTL